MWGCAAPGPQGAAEPRPGRGGGRPTGAACGSRSKDRSRPVRDAGQASSGVASGATRRGGPGAEPVPCSGTLRPMRAAVGAGCECTSARAGRTRRELTVRAGNRTVQNGHPRSVLLGEAVATSVGRATTTARPADRGVRTIYRKSFCRNVIRDRPSWCRVAAVIPGRGPPRWSRPGPTRREPATSRRTCRARAARPRPGRRGRLRAGPGASGLPVRAVGWRSVGAIRVEQMRAVPETARPCCPGTVPPTAAGGT